VRYMSKDNALLFVVNEQTVGRWNRYFKREYSAMDIDAIGFEKLHTWNDEHLDRYCLIIVCIDTYRDYLKYKCQNKNQKTVRQIHLLDIDKKLLRRMIPTNKILYKRNRLRECVDGLINIMRSDSVVSLNSNDVLRLASESELLYQGTEGIKEVILFNMLAKWKCSEDVRSCLVSIGGDITLVDVSEICSLVQKYSGGSLLVGCRYEEMESINVFSLWKLVKKDKI